MQQFVIRLFLLLATAGIVLASALVSAASADDENADRIHPYSKNPFYWQYRGEPVLLVGGSDDDNLFQWTGSLLTNHLDNMVAVGANFVRCTMSDRDEGGYWRPAPAGVTIEHPFRLVGDRYDLDQ